MATKTTTATTATTPTTTPTISPVLTLGPIGPETRLGCLPVGAGPMLGDCASTGTHRAKLSARIRNPERYFEVMLFPLCERRLLPCRAVNNRFVSRHQGSDDRAYAEANRRSHRGSDSLAAGKSSVLPRRRADASSASCAYRTANECVAQAMRISHELHGANVLPLNHSLETFLL